MERVSAEDIRAALAVLRLLFEEAAVVEPKAETAAGGGQSGGPGAGGHVRQSGAAQGAAVSG